MALDNRAGSGPQAGEGAPPAACESDLVPVPSDGASKRQVGGGCPAGPRVVSPPAPQHTPSPRVPCLDGSALPDRARHLQPKGEFENLFLEISLESPSPAWDGGREGDRLEAATREPAQNSPESPARPRPLAHLLSQSDSGASRRPRWTGRVRG